jgi:hypothetical protein
MNSRRLIQSPRRRERVACKTAATR